MAQFGPQDFLRKGMGNIVWKTEIRGSKHIVINKLQKILLDLSFQQQIVNLRLEKSDGPLHSCGNGSLLGYTFTLLSWEGNNHGQEDC